MSWWDVAGMPLSISGEGLGMTGLLSARSTTVVSRAPSSVLCSGPCTSRLRVWLNSRNGRVVFEMAPVDRSSCASWILVPDLIESLAVHRRYDIVLVEETLRIS